MLSDRQGHRIASEVEEAKIRSSMTSDTVAIDLSFAEPKLNAMLTAGDMDRQLAVQLDNVVACARDCVARAGLHGEQLDAST